MNKYDERYDIRLACKADIEMIMEFIDTYWRKDHIMARDRELFEYEYLDGETVNFVLAIDRETGLLEGIFGFLRCSKTEEKDKKDIWGSMWKVNDTHDNIPLLGIELAKRVYELTGCRYQIGNGANPKTTVILRKLYFGEKTEKMQQYYFLNSELEKYKIAVIKNKWKPVNNSELCSHVQRFYSIEEVMQHFNMEKLDVIPFKDNWYFNKRYFMHPIYEYQVYGVSSGINHVEALLVTREIEYENAKVLRIVDYIGNQSLFSGLFYTFQKWIKEKQYEYIDFFELGFNEQAILDAGFKNRNEADGNVIPNYFEPFLQENVDIWVHYKTQGTLFFKADGDQDRPNIRK